MTPGRLFDVLKTMRTEWLTMREIGIELRAHKNTAKVWVREAMAQGVLRSKLAEKQEGRIGPPPSLYAVTREWGGVA